MASACLVLVYSPPDFALGFRQLLAGRLDKLSGRVPDSLIVLVAQSSRRASRLVGGESRGRRTGIARHVCRAGVLVISRRVLESFVWILLGVGRPGCRCCTSLSVWHGWRRDVHLRGQEGCSRPLWRCRLCWRNKFLAGFWRRREVRRMAAPASRHWDGPGLRRRRTAVILGPGGWCGTDRWLLRGASSPGRYRCVRRLAWPGLWVCRPFNSRAGSCCCCRLLSGLVDDIGRRGSLWGHTSRLRGRADWTLAINGNGRHFVAFQTAQADVREGLR